MPPKSSRAPSQSSTAFQRLQEQIKFVDLVIEVLDARAPGSSRHPKALEIFGHKPRLIVITKQDLADPKRLSAWAEHFTHDGDESGQPSDCLVLSLTTQRSKDKLMASALALTEAKKEALTRRGILPRPMRAVVVGMPNVGKSSLINWLISRKKTKVADKPGITRGPQWVRVHPQIELLDTPGILPHVSFKPEVALRLALLNLIPDKTYDHEQVARNGLVLLAANYPELMSSYISDCELDKLSLEEFAIRRNFLTAGGRSDTSRAASTFLTDLRNGRLGRVTLDIYGQRL